MEVVAVELIAVVVAFETKALEVIEVVADEMVVVAFETINVVVELMVVVADESMVEVPPEVRMGL